MRSAFAPKRHPWLGGLPWEPEIVLPGQLERRATARLPEHTLLLAVLEQAIRDLAFVARFGRHPRDVSRNRGHFRADLIAWFSSDSTRWATDFVAICDSFGLDPQAVRRALDQLQWLPLTTPTHGVRVALPGRARRVSLRRGRA